MVVKSLEEYTQDGAADREDELILIKVCLVRAACRPMHTGHHQSLLNVWKEQHHHSMGMEIKHLYSLN